MSGDTDSRRDDDQIFYNVLPFQGRHQKSSPRLSWQDKERHKSRDHMDKEKRDDDSLQPADEEKNSDQTFK